jgi:hypothetical protein
VSAFFARELPGRVHKTGPVPAERTAAEVAE